MATSKQVLTDLETKLVETTNKLHEIYNLVSDFQEGNKQILKERVTQFDVLLKSMDDYCKSEDVRAVRNDLTLPLKVITDIDAGYKPDSYGKECIDTFKKNHSNDTIRHDGLKKLYDSLCEEINQQLDPELAKNIIAASQN